MKAKTLKSGSVAAHAYITERKAHLEQRNFKIRREQLSTGQLLAKAGAIFKKIPTPKGCSISTHDCLMTGMAIHGLKSASLLKFEQHIKNEKRQENIKRLYGISHIPSDTYYRERVDVISSQVFRDVFTEYFALLQRGNVLKEFQFIDGHYLLSGDGTEWYASSKVSCEACGVKEHKNGTTTYYHQMYAGAIVHPDRPNVIPLMPECICRQDGSSKNDCERNSSERFYMHFRREHPHLPVVVVEDALASNGPHLKKLTELNLRYIIGVKEGDHALLFDWFKASTKEELVFEHEGKTHHFRWVNGLPLNNAHFDYKVNMLEYRCDSLRFTWVTDFIITQNNVYDIMKGGRARWKIENETFNTLKNMGYHFEHNFGHGYAHLANNSSIMMVLAFFIDQIQMMVNEFFQLAKLHAGAWRNLWEELRVSLRYLSCESWEMLYFAITYSPP